MLRDRVVALRKANVYAPHFTRHLLSIIRVKSIEDGVVFAHRRRRRSRKRWRRPQRRSFPPGSFEEFSMDNIPLEKARMDAAGWMKAGPCRPPYHVVPAPYV